ncbi:hypothetical protein Q8A64_17830 [Oxalobacteraceae bacterium R-40]|uniref:Uncharacterized protein n=1 Tax=Keguizhuia sedimenti TaxID=3064264 RepID=A0ABU1BTP4_9BURK|nr:hypothetical protein [Oxalobacteraceae bacterium R-40]
MFGLFAKQKKVRTVSAAERAALIAKLVATLGTQYSGLKQYRSVQVAGR